MATVTSSKRHLLVTSDTYTSNGDVTVGGDLFVNGSQTTINTATLNVEDKNITLNYGGNEASSQGAGITIAGSNATLIWDEANTKWSLSNGLAISGDISASNLSGTNTGDQVLPTDFVSKANGGTFSGNLNIGANTVPKSLYVYGAGTGEGMFWDGAQSHLTIKHDDGDLGLEIYTVNSTQPTTPQLKIGRNSTEYWGVYTADRDTFLIHRQDETDGDMRTNFDMWDSNTSDNTGNWRWRSGDGTGSNMYTALTLYQDGDANFAGNLYVPEYIYHNGNTTTYTRFQTNRLTLNSGGGAVVDLHSNGQLYFTGVSTFYNNATFAGNIIMGSGKTVDGVDISALPTSFAPTDAEANVQADWTETTTTSDAFILNKPSTFPPSSHNHDGRYPKAYVSTAATSWDSTEFSQYSFSGWDASGADWTPSTGWYWGLTLPHVSNTSSYNYSGQIVISNASAANMYVRTISNGSENSWKQVYHEGHKPTWTEVTSKPATFPPSTHNHDGRYLRTHARYQDDLDTINSSGVYIWDVSEADDEPTGASDGLLTVKYWDSSSWATASFQDFHNRKLYITSKKSGTWLSDWAQVWTTDQLTTTNKSNYDTAYTHSQAAHAPSNAEANVQADWNATSGDAFIQNKPTIPTSFNNLNAVDDRDMAPEDRSYSDDFRIFFTSKEGLEDGTSTGSNWQDALFISSYSDSSGGNPNLLAFDKSEKKIYHYQASATASSWGTAKQIAYTDEIPTDFVSKANGGTFQGAININGLLDVNTGAANTTAIFESTDDKAFIRIKDDDTDTYLISKDNKFSIGESSTDYDNFKVDITTGDATFAGDVTADSFKVDGETDATKFLKGDGTLDNSTYLTSTNLDGYLLNTTDTFTGKLSIANTQFTGLSLTRNSTNGSNIDFNNSNGLLGRAGFLSNGTFAITNGGAGTYNMLSIESDGDTTLEGTLTSGAHTINTSADNALTINQTGTDTGWSYINFNTSGTRNYFIGQDASKNFDIYNDNLDGTAISIGYADNNVTFGGNIVMGNGKTVDGVDISALPTTFAPTNAEQNVQADWTETTTTSDAFILNKPSTFPPSSHTHTFASLTSKPTTLSGYGITDAVKEYINHGVQGDHDMHTWNKIHATYNDSSSGNIYWLIETNVPQSSYSMGGFEIIYENDYSDVKDGGKINVFGYWNPESNGGFIGFKYTTDNPNLSDGLTFKVGANSSGKVCFLMSGSDQNYTQIIAQNLWLGYSANSAAASWGDSWSISNVSTHSINNLNDVQKTPDARWDNIEGKPSTFAPTDAEANVNADWNATSGDAQILNKPTIPTDFVSKASGGTFQGDVKITSSVGGKLHLRSTDTTIADGDYVGNLYFEGVDSGGAADSVGASIHAIADGTWSNTVAPTELVFKTRNVTGGTTTALTLNKDQSATFAGSIISGNDITAPGDLSVRDITATGGDITVKDTGTENAMFRAYATGTGYAGIIMDASNGDGSGSDYFTIRQLDNKEVEFNSRANAGNTLFYSKGVLNLTQDGANSTFAGDIIMGSGKTVDGVDISALPTSFAPVNAEANVNADWNATSGDAQILNKPNTFEPSAHVYHQFVEDAYYFDDYNGRKMLNAYTKTMRSDIIRYRNIGNFHYWNGSSWVLDNNQIASVRNLLDGRKDTYWQVPSTYYKFRFEVTPSTTWATMALIGLETSWTGSSFPGCTMTVEQYDTNTSSWSTVVTAEFNSTNGVTNWGSMYRADTALHTGKGGGSHGHRITIDFYGWTPSNNSYVTIPLLNIHIFSNYAGLENTDYANLLDYYQNVTIAGGLTAGSAISTSGYVGAGTTNPVRQLEVSSGKLAIVRISSTDNGNWTAGEVMSGIEFYSDDASGVGPGVRSSILSLSTDTYGSRTELTFSTTGSSLDTEAMRIDSYGRVGIGTTSPIGKLDVRTDSSWNNSGIVFKNTSNANPIIAIYRPTGSGSNSYPWHIQAGGSTSSSLFIRTGSGANVGSETVSDKLEITSSGTLTVTGDVIAYGSPSDKKYKENIKPIDNALNKVIDLEGVSFDWKKSKSILNIKEDIGFIAQDVQKVIPELVRENEDGNLSLRYQGLTPFLVEAIKELKTEIETLKKEILTLKLNKNGKHI